MKTQLLHRPEIQQVSGPLVLALDELVSAINVQPLEVGTVKVWGGTLAPEGRVTGTLGDLFIRTDGIATGGIVFQKQSGVKTTTGWVPMGVGRGTWIPSDNSGAGLALTLNQPAVYAYTLLPTGKQVTASLTVTYPATASGANASLKGLPFACGTTAGGALIAYQNSGVAFTAQVAENSSAIAFYTLAGVAITNAQLTGKVLELTATYLSS